MPDVFDALASPARRSLLEQLRRGPARAGSLGLELPISREAVSKHLRLLVDAGLLTVEVQGRERLYRLEAGALEPVDAWLDPYREFWVQRLDALETELARGRRSRRADTPSRPQTKGA